jgi:polyisoprenyl-teichoic acid--peptidoglycan teichoic acid transferase
VHRLSKRARAKRHQERFGQYRQRRLMAVAVLVGFFWSIWSSVGIFQNGGGSKPSNSAVRGARFGSLARRRRRGALMILSALPVVFLLTWALPTMGSELTYRIPFFVDAREAEAGSLGAPDKPALQEPPEASSKSLNVLVLGVDRRPEEVEGSPTRSDTMMLVQATPETGRIELLSVPRDLLVEVAPGVEDRINTAYTYGGTEQAKSVMENLTGIPIDRYVIIDFKGFEEVIDALGGITVGVEQPIRVGIEGHRVYIPAGTQELDGLEALAYARYRGTPCGDLDRIDRQQQLVAALGEQALQWNTITELPGIIKIMNENVDTNLEIIQAISLGRTLAGHAADGEMRSAQLKGKPEILPNGEAVLVPDEQANASILEGFRYDGSQVRRFDRVPRPGDPSSKC